MVRTQTEPDTLPEHHLPRAAGLALTGTGWVARRIIAAVLLVVAVLAGSLLLAGGCAVVAQHLDYGSYQKACGTPDQPACK